MSESLLASFGLVTFLLIVQDVPWWAAHAFQPLPMSITQPLMKAKKFGFAGATRHVPQPQESSTIFGTFPRNDRLSTTFRNAALPKREIFPDDLAPPPAGGYDAIIVGSGNGACGFISNLLEQIKDDEDFKILVLEEGENFFDTSDITHQNSWTKSYSEGNIFKLHNARTPTGKPIVSGRACTMGGGGSINYTMIHESSKWLAKNIGFDEAYWDYLKETLNGKFNRTDPSKFATPVTKAILEAGDHINFQKPNKDHAQQNIPSYYDQDEKQLYQFPTQFNMFGQRTNSGVSLVNWENTKVQIETRTSVRGLDLNSKGRCTAVQCTDLNTNESYEYHLAKDGRLIMCAGAATPRILMPHREAFDNNHIGKFVNDHICIPLGIYLPKSPKLEVLGKDIYGPVFGTYVVKGAKDTEEEDTVVCIDFFTGPIQKQLYMTSHLFLAFVPNFIKSPMLRVPFLFTIIKNAVRILVSIVGWFISLFTRKDPEFVTAIIKYNAAKAGQYEDERQITLNWFDGSSRDAQVAKEAIKEAALPFMNELGEQPNFLIRAIYRLFTKVSYEASQVDSYVENYSHNSLLSEQHMAGGCLFGKVLETGEQDKTETGKVRGSENIYVADLSSVDLPRVSPQMTAYIIGYHVAEQLYGKR